MKTKLLKKVRRRYSIVKVIELGTNPSESHVKMKTDHGLPFYALFDHEFNGVTEYYELFKDYEHTFRVLMKWIKKDYTHKVRNKKNTVEKVWWSKM